MAGPRGALGEYALPLLLEAILQLLFGVVGSRLSTVMGLFVPLTAMLLCFSSSSAASSARSVSNTPEGHGRS